MGAWFDFVTVVTYILRKMAAIPHQGMDVLAEENGEGEEETGEGEQRGSIDEDEDPSELVVLDPSHPLMERVQAALSEQLKKQNEKLEHEVLEKRESLKAAVKTREEIGVDLYGVQQQLARQQMLIEKEQDNHSAIIQVRHQKEQSMQNILGMHQKMQEQLKQDEDHASNLRSEMENAAIRLNYLNEAHSTVQQDIALTVRATEKAVADVDKAQQDKLKQDLYLDRLTREVEQLEEKIALANMQCQAQAQETKAMKETLAEAAMELEALCFEKKKLMAQWNSSLVGMKRRDEAYFAMVTARNIQQQKIHSTNTEQENYKKSIVQEQEQNEQLTLILHKIETDISHVKRHIAQCETKTEAFKAEYMTYTRALQETEQALTAVTGECTMKNNEILALRTQIEREGLEKRRLEDAVMENMMQRLTMDKATQYSQKSLEKLRKSVQELEMSIATVDNEVSGAALEVSNVLSMLKRLEAALEESNNAIQTQNNEISKSEAEIGRNNALIERKQTQIDQMNKKIELKISKAGGGENLGPWELRIDELQKQISDSMEVCAKMQQHWLRQQNELVKKTVEIDELVKMTDDLQKKELILSQKKIRLDDELTVEERSFVDVKKSIETLQKDMVRLNGLITGKKGEQYKLEQSNTLLEKDFISALKEAELEFIQLQVRLNQLQEEKERVTNSLLEAEHQIMLWERKIKLAKEMKESVDSDAGQAEIKAMKAEIHRMQVRHSQLQRQQETMIQEMEKAVYRRETIIQRNEAQSKSGKNKQTQGYLKKKIADTGRKIKQTQKDISNCEKSIGATMKAQSDIVNEIQEREASCEALKDDKESIQQQLQDTEKSKQMAMSELLLTQSQVKSLTAAKENKYRLLHKSSEVRLADMQRQKEKLQSFWSVVQKIEKEELSQHPLLETLGVQIMTRLKRLQQEEPSTVTVS